jgi:phosphatidyl-myo-inositol dimannoside synthase
LTKDKQVPNPAHTLVLSEHFFPSCGGTITWLLQTYSRYHPDDVVILAGEHPAAKPSDYPFPFKVERIPMRMADWDPTQFASFLCYFSMVLKLRKALHQYRIRQIHCMKVLPEALAARCAGWWSGIPYLLYAHGEEIQMRFTSRKLSWLIPFLYRGAAAIIANSRHTKNLLEEIGVRSERIHIIHPGVDAAAFSATAAEMFAVKQRHSLGAAPILLTIGRLQRRKGQDMVIRALPLIRKRFPDVKYLIVGSGEELETLKRIAKDAGVDDAVIFVGSIADNERAAYYAAADVFLMPNRQVGVDIEGFGIVFLEAGAAGKPVIGGQSGGTGDAIEHGLTGIQVDGESLNTIVDAVVELLENPEKSRAMGIFAKQRVQRAFSWDSIVERTREITLSHCVKGN